jgi:hypothetical protein
MVGKHGIQTFKVVIIVLLLSFDVLSLQVHISYSFGQSGLSEYT